MSKQRMTERGSGLYLGPWAARVLTGLAGITVVAVVAAVLREMPGMVRYAKIKLM
ncbi:hypothetical protein [Saccharomonospora sp.]|uniref:hypothetical protein n=1 Tax=Saccharomonospora sp. TaxID=33913 RepID=UPI00263862E3|nr:hypothetical protein [Saccharomonospora sp.]